MNPANNTAEVENHSHHKNFLKFKVFQFFGLSVHHTVVQFLDSHTKSNKGLGWTQTNNRDIFPLQKEEFHPLSEIARLLLLSGGNISQCQRFSIKIYLLLSLCFLELENIVVSIRFCTGNENFDVLEWDYVAGQWLTSAESQDRQLIKCTCSPVKLQNPLKSWSEVLKLL